ncbi:ankyrin repeat domain-containing protein [Brevundimonas sp. R86498]|uniref:ankyrin repeat domain-containing protein n=1 Tax=Brevundimonas sp. R86498 TaxID=3093845 RepID=UPI0037C82065
MLPKTLSARTSAPRLVVAGVLTAAALGGIAIQASAQTSPVARPPALASGAWLVDAARNGDTRAAEVFIAHGADVDQGKPGDGTPLIVAARNGDMTMARFLVEQGAAVDRSLDGDGNPLINAAASGHLEMAKYLISSGANVNAVVPNDETPLINAAREGHLDLVQELVEAGADVNLAVPVTLRSGATEFRSPLSQARLNRHANVAAYLIARGAHI